LHERSPRDGDIAASLNSTNPKKNINNRIINLATHRLRPAVAVAAMVGLMAVSVSAADQKASVDPRADELLKRMGDYLGQAQFFSVSAEVWQDIQLSSGQRIRVCHKNVIRSIFWNCAPNDVPMVHAQMITSTDDIEEKLAAETSEFRRAMYQDALDNDRRNVSFYRQKIGNAESKLAEAEAAAAKSGASAVGAVPHQ